MIDLGLARIGRLLQQAPAPAWKAIHVAGTNGKGSVCAYVTALLHARGVPVARFTSPHLVDRWDSVVVEEQPVAEVAFRAAEQAVAQRDRAAQVGATEFELLTATAFEVFGGWAATAAAAAAAAAATARTAPSASSSPLAVSPLAVVEAGLGGELDATTAMRAERVVTVVTRIGLDHEALLGRSTAAIAAHKAGIMRPGVPCVVDPANRDDAAVRAVLEARARAVGAPLVYPEPLVLDDSSSSSSGGGSGGSSSSSSIVQSLEPHQRTNLACAYAAFQIAVGELGAPVDAALLAAVVPRVRWPGRLQTIDVGPLLAEEGGVAGGPKRVAALLDGAHNAQSADVLAAYVDKHLRGGGGLASSTASSPPPVGVTWILAASAGKDVDGILRRILRPGDRVAAVTFGPVDGMPWVQPAAPRDLLARAAAVLQLDGQDGQDGQDGEPSSSSSSSRLFGDQTAASGADAHAQNPRSLVAALRWATSPGSPSGPLVIAGSLYLVSDTLRLLRAAGGETGLP